MKKILVVVALMAVCGLGVFAGPYFEVETDPLTLGTTLDVGWDGAFSVALPYSAPGVSEGVFVRSPIATWDITMGLTTAMPEATFGAEIVFDGGLFDVTLATDLALDYGAFPAMLDVNEWSGLFKVLAEVDVVQAWVSASLDYIPANIPFPWLFSPRVGLSCHW